MQVPIILYLIPLPFLLAYFTKLNILSSFLIVLGTIWTLLISLFIKSDCNSHDAGLCTKPSISIFLPSIVIFGLAYILAVKK
jgi:hypothetical protein